MDTGSSVPAVLPNPLAAFRDPQATSAFDGLAFKVVPLQDSRAHYILPTPVDTDDPGKVMVPRDADWDVRARKS